MKNFCRYENPMTNALTIDLKKKRIRIYLYALHDIGDPEYIQLLVNPASRTIAVRSCREDEKYAQKIYWKNMKDKGQSCELYSKDLIDGLQPVLPHTPKPCSYRIYGKTSPHKSALFNLEQAVPIDDED